ncbi:hypothetical protein I316_06191 [Kwoniella heveanensis BCC8398]|uniref:BZIP domain-containing protein n=1 Tax=Kwoniella heveanensis BCC8398 TaxID=1296120 RepID=A0A1B9GMH6_9TREE|nr:hypothetical protein I316_06191 [Kwoniella heveanensis BCC8398]
MAAVAQAAPGLPSSSSANNISRPSSAASKPKSESSNLVKSESTDKSNVKPSAATVTVSEATPVEEKGEVKKENGDAQPLGPPPNPEQSADGSNPQRPPIRPNSAIRSRFDQEPNPFEQSFSRSSHHSQSSLSDRTTPPRGTDATSTRHNALPPLSSLTSPAAADPSQFPWLANSLRSGPLSPAMLAGPQNGQPPPNASGQRGGPNNEAGGPHPNEGAFESTGFRTGFTPGTGSGFTPGYNALLNSSLGALAMPSPNTAAFLNSITNATPIGGESDVAAATGVPGQHMPHHPHDGNLHPPSALPPHMQPHHPLPHTNSQGEVPQDTITPNTLSALTGVFGEMARAQPGPQPGPSYYAPAMGPPHPMPAPMPHVDYAQQSANAASQAANGLFLLSQAHQELSKREEEGRTPPQSAKGPGGRSASGKAANGGAGQKRKSDVGPTGSATKPAKKGKKNSSNNANNNNNNNSASGSTPPKPAKAPTMSPNDSVDSDDDDDNNGLNASGKPETEEDKRKNFLERNRQAALKCRQRKKAWLNELQTKVEGLTIENERLQQTIQSMHEEVGRLTAILMQHRDCGLGIPTAYGRPIR